MQNNFERGPLIGAAALAVAALVFAIVLGRSVAAPGSALQTTSPTEGEEAESAVALEDVAVETPKPVDIRNGEGARTESRVAARVQARDGDYLPVEVLRLAVDRAPFDPGRRPSEPYRMPGDPVERPEREREPPPPPPAFQVLGTVQDGNGGVAVIRLADGEPQVMTEGEELSGYTLGAVGKASVTMVGPDHSLQLAVADASPISIERDDDDDDDRRRSRRDRERAERRQEDAAEFRAEAMQTARALQAETGGQVTVQMTEDGVVIVGPDGEQRTLELPSSLEGEERILGAMGAMRLGTRLRFQPRGERPAGG